MQCVRKGKCDQWQISVFLFMRLGLLPVPAQNVGKRVSASEWLHCGSQSVVASVGHDPGRFQETVATHVSQ